MTDHQLVAAIERGDHQQLNAWFATLSSAGPSVQAQRLALSPMLDSRLMALNIIAEDLARGRDPARGGQLAEACLDIARRHLDNPEFSRTIIAEKVGHAANSLAMALTHAGQYEAVVTLAREVTPLLEGRTDGMRSSSLRLKAIEALEALNRLEEAERELITLEASGSADPNVSFVRERLQTRLRSAATLPEDRPVGEQYRDGLVGQVSALRDLFNQWSGSEAIGSALDGLVEQARREPVRSDRDVFERANRFSGQLASLVGVQNTDAYAWQTRVRNQSSVFLDKECRDPAVLLPALSEFQAAASWFDANRRRDDGHNARWCSYLALRRLGRIGEALTSLDQLRRRLEEDRSGISDPLRRANSMASFPHLYAAMVECAAELDDPKGMLAAMEGAKGRVLADVLTLRDGTAFDEQKLHVSAESITGLTAEMGIHYLSFLATEESVFAVCVAPSGTWHWRKIGMDQVTRERLCRRLQPASWSAPSRSGAPFDLGEGLSPLVDWLKPVLAERRASELPHIVYSPDAQLHQLPLQLARLDGEPVGASYGLSRVHGIDAVRRIAGRKTRRPSAAVAIFIPTRNELEIAEKQQAMAATVEMLSTGGRISLITSEEADETCLSSLAVRDAVVHINAHGIFPEAGVAQEGIDPNPYRSAGLLLAHHGALPERASTWPYRLTPSLIIESQEMRLDRSTVVLQGCVSGLAKEGAGGDALGIEWALLAKGATSVLASHWHVDYRSAGAFCRNFYDAWLNKGHSRVAAWRLALRKTREEPGGGEPADWAAFSLSGDWR